ncbi:ORF28 [White spot syndrome virus]|uniref:ORF28 n=1 Tax=White spot syndrome virus TaxID=342409 RepID=A0A2D3I6C8_9VIRU|nr:ORF28 [White spot syndrome virus]
MNIFLLLLERKGGEISSYPKKTSCLIQKLFHFLSFRLHQKCSCSVKRIHSKLPMLCPFQVHFFPSVSKMLHC